MPNLRAEASMHARQGQTPEALGARERARQDASQARPHAGGHDNPPADRRASVRHAQGMDEQAHFLTRTLEKVKTEPRGRSCRVWASMGLIVTITRADEVRRPKSRFSRRGDFCELFHTIDVNRSSAN